MDDLYTAEAFFGRLDDLIIKGKLDMGADVRATGGRTGSTS